MSRPRYPVGQEKLVIGGGAPLVTGVQRALKPLQRRVVSPLEVERILPGHAAHAHRPHRQPPQPQQGIHLVERRDELRRQGLAAPVKVCRLGLAGTVIPETQTLLGRAPISMRQFIQDHKACWM